MKKEIGLALILMFVPVIAFSSEHQQKQQQKYQQRNSNPGRSANRNVIPSVNAPHSRGGGVPYWPSVGTRHASGGIGVYHGGYSGGSGTHYGYYGGGSYHGGHRGGYYHRGWGYSYPWWSFPTAIVGLALVDGFLFGYPALYGYPGPYYTVPPPPQYAGPMPGYWQWIPENGQYVWICTQ
jgi:hypothetical protein